MLALLDPLQACLGGQLHDGVSSFSDVKLHAVKEGPVVSRGALLQLESGFAYDGIENGGGFLLPAICQGLLRVPPC